MNPYCLFPCAKCGSSTLLPFATLQTPMTDLNNPSSDFPAVAVSCPECKYVATHQVKRAGVFQEGSGDRLVWLDRDQDYGFAAQLECEMEDCGERLTVFAPRSRQMSPEEKAADVATWHWDELRCPSGHVIQKPRTK